MTGLRSQLSMKRGSTATICLQSVTPLFKGGHSAHWRVLSVIGIFHQLKRLPTRWRSDNFLVADHPTKGAA
jgi:hypothetical protein